MSKLLKIISKGKMSNKIIGWNEWCSLPDINILAIKAKIDTGARTSCLHAFDIKEYYHNNKLYINFLIQPIQKNNSIILKCSAPVNSQRIVRNSTGQQELRYFIKTILSIGSYSYVIDLNLTNRNNMKFKMLIGRKALENRFIIDSSKKYLTGRISQEKINKIYDIQSIN